MIKKNSPNVIALAIGVGDEHQMALTDLVRRAGWNLSADADWTLGLHPTLASALPSLQSGKTPIVLCDADSGPGNWQEMLDLLHLLPDPPLVIVTSRLADDRLWSEALNCGAYDVLAKPYNTEEVVRVLSTAWLRSQRTHSAAPRVPVPSRALGPRYLQAGV